MIFSFNAMVYDGIIGCMKNLFNEAEAQKKVFYAYRQHADVHEH